MPLNARGRVFSCSTGRSVPPLSSGRRNKSLLTRLSLLNTFCGGTDTSSSPTLLLFSLIRLMLWFSQFSLQIGQPGILDAGGRCCCLSLKKSCFFQGMQDQARNFRRRPSVVATSRLTQQKSGTSVRASTKTVGDWSELPSPQHGLGTSQRREAVLWGVGCCGVLVCPGFSPGGRIAANTSLRHSRPPPRPTHPTHPLPKRLLVVGLEFLFSPNLKGKEVK